MIYLRKNPDEFQLHIHDWQNLATVDERVLVILRRDHIVVSLLNCSKKERCSQSLGAPLPYQSLLGLLNVTMNAAGSEGSFTLAVPRMLV